MNKTPAVRFKGFSDEWEQRKLGNLGTLKNGMNFSKDAMGIGFPFVNGCPLTETEMGQIITQINGETPFAINRRLNGKERSSMNYNSNQKKNILWI